MLNIAVRAARKAGDIIARGFERLDNLKVNKKAGNEYSTEIDNKAEQEILYTLKKAYPEHAIIAEESGEQPGNDYVWIIDPLDGTNNFMRGLPHFAVSIALQVKGVIEHAVIYDPIRQDLFTASKGRGAQLNERRLRIKVKNDLQDALLAMSLPFYQKNYQERVFALWQDLATEIMAMRRMGSAALDLAYVAASRLDGYCEMNLHNWDIAAGSLIVREAGGLVSDLQAQENYLQSGHILAASPKVYAALIEKLNKHGF